MIEKKNGFLHFYIFDILAYNNKALLNTIFEKRIKLLNSLPRSLNYIEYAEYKKGKELWELYCKTIADGGEGVVIQKDSSIYLQGKRRAKESLKLKKELSDTYYHGWASAVSFSVMKDGKPKHIAWISGITDELKNEIVNNPEKWKGKVAELTAMMTECIDGEYSLRHGRIETRRNDKRPEDCDYSQIAK